MAPHTRRQRALVEVALLVLGIGSCSDANGPRVPYPMSAVWAGAPWLGNAYALLDSSPGQPAALHLWGTRPVEQGAMADQVMTATIRFTGPGVYPLDSTNASYEVLLGGDVIWERYDATGSPAGLLTVTTFDDSAKTIEGTISFASRATRMNRTYGDFPKFEAGKFKAKYNTYP